jgi:hypothetical protein
LIERIPIDLLNSCKIKENPKFLTAFLQKKINNKNIQHFFNINYFLGNIC